MDDDRPAQPGVRGARVSDPAGDPDPADRGRRDRRRACRAVQRVAAGDLPAPEGAGARRAHLAHPARDRPAQPPRCRAAPRGDHLACPLPAVLGREPRAARRAARGAASRPNGRPRPRQDGLSEGKPTMDITQITAEPGIPQILISRVFDAPRDLVFRAYTDPELLVQWLGPRDLTMKVEEFDVRDGGKWRYVSRDADGNEYGFHGVFHGTPSPDGIVQTFEFEGVPGATGGGAGAQVQFATGGPAVTAYPIQVYWSHEDGAWIADVPDL